MGDEHESRGPGRAPGASRRATTIAIGLAVLVAGLVAAKGWDAWVREPRAAAADDAAFGVDRTDVPAPAIELATLDGRRVSLASLRGQVVFVNFWATWCPPCRTEMPSMLQLGRELEQRFPGKFRMVAVSVDDGWQPVGEFFGGPPPPGLTVALDTDQLVTRAYYCAARRGCPESYKFPETYVVDPSGRIVAYVVGPRDWSAPEARRFLERLLRAS